MNIRLGGNDMNTAWLLDTLGKAKVTGSVKKTILKVSIPKLCADLQLRGESLRYNSKILRGITLMHSLKVDYYMDDMKLYNSRVFRDYSHNNKHVNYDKSNQLVKGGNGKRTGEPKVLSDDPLFNIFIDLIPTLELELENARKRRRMSIELADANNYADTQMESFGKSKNDFYQLVDDFIDQDVNLSFNESSQLSQVDPDFEFNTDGGIKLIDKQPAKEIENRSMEIDLGDFDLGNMDQNLDELDENGVSISRDDNFFISASKDQQVNLITRVRKSRKVKVIADLPNKFSRTQLQNFATIYEDSMKIPLGKINQQQRIGEVYQEYNQVPPYVNYCQKAIFGKHYQIFMQQYDSRTFTLDNDITTINREIDTIRRVQNMPQSLDFEISRNVQQSQLLQHDGYEVLQGIEQNEYENEDDDYAMNISFGDIDHSSQLSQYNYHHQESDGLDDDMPKILDSTQLTKYYNFLLVQHANIDNQSETQYRFNLPIEENAIDCQYKRIKLTKLVPNNTTEDYPISKKLAVRSFYSLLALASKNYIAIAIEPITKTAPYQLSDINEIDIIVPINN